MVENEGEEMQEPPSVESAESNTADADAGAAPIPIKDPFRPIPLHLETALRMTATCFVGYSLSYAGTLGYVDSIPPSLAWLIGLISAACATRLPVVAALPFAALLPGTTVILFSLAVSTALLCAATVSDALFVACSALFSLWVGNLRFGKTGKATQILAPLVVVVFGMIGLGLQRLVRDGITISISSDLLGAMLGTDLKAIPEDQLLTSLSMIDLEVLDPSTLLARMSPFVQQFESRFEEVLATLRETIGVIEVVTKLIVKIVQDGFVCFEFAIPDTFFSDQTVCVTFTEERDLFIHMEGGLWLIRRLWTTTGLDNPFALFPNFLVAMSWASLALCTGILIPPLRTVRYSLARIALPNTLRDAAWFLQRRLGEDDRETMTEEEKVVGRRLVKAVSKFHGGTIAIATAFEPRFSDFRFNLPRCTWWKLIAVTKAVETAAMTALLSSVMYSRHASTDLLSVCATYEKIAEALQEKSGSQKIATVEETSAPMKLEDDQLGIEQSGRTLAESVDSWNEAMHPTSTVSWSEAGKEAALVAGVFLGPTLLLLARLTQILFSPILAVTGREKWNLYKGAHVVKFAIGFTAIVCLSLYSDYHDLEVTTKDEANTGFEILNGTPISSFVAWDLMAYSFATMPTTEGTVKKCTFRVLGTLMGAFSAFLLIRATGDNMYGSVAWLTVTAFPAIYIMIEDNDSAAMGPSKNFGYGGFYFVLTQTAIVMEYLAGLGNGDDLVVNRLLSNLLGIAMACFLAVIPPNVMGGDPKWTELILQETKSATEQFILGLLDDDEAALVQLQKSHSAEFDALQVDATFLFEDAKRGSMFPFYRVDERLGEEIDQLVITSVFLQFLIARAIEARKTEGEDALFARDSQSSFDLFNVLRSIRKPPAKEDLKQELVVLSGDPECDLINELRLLARRIAQHESTLGSLDGNTSIPDPGDPAHVEALHESISKSLLIDREVPVEETQLPTADYIEK
jgi:hypothetical protein